MLTGLQFERPIRLLMLESHQPDVDLMKETLELAGLPAQVTAVTTAEEVLYTAEDGELDIALLNLGLPHMSSDLVDELRSLDGARRLPIIVLSEGHAEHADHVFTKPEHEAEYMGIVAAIRFYWMSASPSIAPPPPGVSERPQRLSGIDLMGLPIEPVEAYLLSMLDGQMSVDEISLSMGSEVADTRAILRRLAGLGAVMWHAPHPSLVPPPPPMAHPSVNPTLGAARTERASEPAPEERTAVLPPEARDVTRPEAAATKPGDGPGKRLTTTRKQSINDAFALLGEADHYELLGVPRDATKKRIRDEYFKLAKFFHTDTLFGVELDDYGRKMDRVFQALTEAYEVLSKKKKRRAYDAYLGAVSETETLEPPRHSTAPRSSVRPSVPAIAQSMAPIEAPKITMGKPSTRRSRREVATRLLERRGAAAAPREPASGVAMKALARTLKVVAMATSMDRVDRLIADACRAEEAGNVLGAAEALRIASAWRPDDADLSARAEQARRLAVSAKAPAFEKRARYAEETGNWEEAALCWSRLADVRLADADAAKRAASALLRAHGDLKQAVAYAKRAGGLSPEDADCQTVLGEVWLAAGMPASAKRAFEDAQRINPKHERSKRLLGELAA